MTTKPTKSKGQESDDYVVPRALWTRIEALIEEEPELWLWEVPDGSKLDENSELVKRALRRMRRTEKWAMSQTHEVLAAEFAGLLHRYIFDRRLLKDLKNRTLAREIIDYEQRASGSKKRSETDPKSQAIRAIREEFDRWQDGKKTYKNGAAFARAMCAAHGEIESEGSIIDGSLTRDIKFATE